MTPWSSLQASNKEAGGFTARMSWSNPWWIGPQNSSLPPRRTHSCAALVHYMHEDCFLDLV